MVERGRVLAERSDLRPEDHDYLGALVADWTLVADLAFADLVLWVPTWDFGGFTAVAQARPSTGPTAIPEDVVGRFIPKGRRMFLDRAFASGQIVRKPGSQGSGVEEGIPVSRDGRVIAVIARYAARRPAADGALERAYLSMADDLVAMITSGDFPVPEGLATTDSPPRVGDGFIRLDTQGRVQLASPNAISAFHRLGLAADFIGSDLAATAARLSKTPGPVDESLTFVATGRTPGSAQIENSEAAVTLRSIPLRRKGELTGALVLSRDVTDLRRQERALLTKESTIREIHHRVKNNLQTVAALLRLQARGIESPEGRAALAEAVRRVGSIAVVHETLAQEHGDDANFDEVADRIVALTRDLAGGSQVRRVGSAGRLPADVVTPLAMVLAELLANAVQHGLAGAAGDVTLRLSRTGRRVIAEVSDDGVGLPDGFDPAESTGLGLRIVRTLVAEELSGAVTWEPNTPHGTRAVVDAMLLA
ncbi:MAG: histidine kinase N-terminal domain-containing protein [Actinomycetes bacterium]